MPEHSVTFFPVRFRHAVPPEFVILSEPDCKRGIFFNHFSLLSRVSVIFRNRRVFYKFAVASPKNFSPLISIFFAAEILAENIYFGDSKKEEDGGSAAATTQGCGAPAQSGGFRPNVGSAQPGSFVPNFGGGF